VAEKARGPGMVLSWEQSSGCLVAGGNSSTLRVWDLGREQCVRVFETGLDTCLTALASRTVAMEFNGGTGLLGGGGNAGPGGSGGGGGGGGGGPDYSYPNFGAYSPAPPGAGFGLGPAVAAANTTPLASWTFAGFADGTVAVFDERVPAFPAYPSAHGGTHRPQVTTRLPPGAFPFPRISPSPRPLARPLCGAPGACGARALLARPLRLGRRRAPPRRRRPRGTSNVSLLIHRGPYLSVSSPYLNPCTPASPRSSRRLSAAWSSSGTSARCARSRRSRCTSRP